MNNLFKKFGIVSRETIEKLTAFEDSLLKWNKSINLISPNTTNQAQLRHIVDSLQLLPFIPQETKSITDLGSGGGLPSVPLAICLPEVKVHAVESDRRKAAFLQSMSHKLAPNLIVHNKRVENMGDWDTDILTCRAFAPLHRIFTYSKSYVENTKLCLFLKGQNGVKEIEEALLEWSFDYNIHQSATEKDSMIIAVTKTAKRTNHD